MMQLVAISIGRFARSKIDMRRMSIGVIAVLLIACVQARAEPIEIYESLGSYTLQDIPPDVRPIILDIPPDFFYNSSYREVTKVWGINLLTYYPSFTSLSDPRNSNYGTRCVGICNGRVLVHISNQSRRLGKFHNMGDAIAQGELSRIQRHAAIPNARVEALNSADAWFDQGFKLHRLNAAGEHIAPTETLYLLADSTNRSAFELTATCDTNSDRTTCILHFSASCVPSLYVTVNGLDESYLRDAREIMKKTNAFLASMIRSHSCSG